MTPVPSCDEGDSIRVSILFHLCYFTSELTH